MNTALLRYNLRVLVFNNWWLLVFPIAVSQATVFWTILTETPNEIAPARWMETVTPLLTAFLCAHVLSAEYRSRIGAILASKPIDARKVVFWRLAVAFALVWILSLLSLIAFSFPLGPINVPATFAAGIPSSLFLGMLALTCATMFRNPLAGFAATALYWAMDLPPGLPLNPFLSLKSYTNYLIAADSYGSQPLSQPWWIAKLLLVIGAALLYFAHARLLFTLGTPAAPRIARRGIVLTAALLAVYLVAGAGTKVAYGYANRGTLIPDDGAWFRSHFAAYGPIPISSIFGSSFRMYLGSFPKIWRMNPDEDAERWDDTPKHRQDLKRVVETMPNSMWAPSAAELLARLEETDTDKLDSAVALYRLLEQKYAGSPYRILAMRGAAKALGEANRENEARAAYEALLQRAPGSAFETEALKYLVDSHRKRNELPRAAERAEQWAAIAAIQEKYLALVTLAEVHREAGDKEKAREAAHKALKATSEFRQADRDRKIPANRVQIAKWQGESAGADNRARIVLQWAESP